MASPSAVQRQAPATRLQPIYPALLAAAIHLLNLLRLSLRRSWDAKLQLPTTVQGSCGPVCTTELSASSSSMSKRQGTSVGRCICRSTRMRPSRRRCCAAPCLPSPHHRPTVEENFPDQFSPYRYVSGVCKVRPFSAAIDHAHILALGSIVERRCPVAAMMVQAGVRMQFRWLLERSDRSV